MSQFPHALGDRSTVPDAASSGRKLTGVGVALNWVVATVGLTYLLVSSTGARGPGAARVDVPLAVVVGGWAVQVAMGWHRLAAAWVAYVGLAAILFSAAVSGGVQSPILLLLLLHLSFVERFLDRRRTLWIVGLGVAGAMLMALADGLGQLGPPLYQHAHIETSLLVGASIVLAGVLQAGRWDERSTTMERLLRTTESLRAVNSVLASTRTDAVARARQQQVLARLTVHAFSHIPSADAPDQSELDALIARCCAITLAELEGGHVRVRTLEPEAVVVAELGHAQPASPDSSRSEWPVDVLGSPWGVLEVEIRRPGARRPDLTPNDRLFIEGIVSLLSAAVGRAHTARALREMEDQLRAAQRFEGLALKASGVVHDLNNALTCILQNTELAKDGVGQQADVEGELDDIWRAAMGATDMARRLLESARSADPQEDRRVQFPEVVVEELRSHGVLLGEHITLDCDVADFDGWVPLSPGAAHQVFMNLLVNARQAMAGGGHLMVVLGPAVLADGRQWVQLEVSDTGPGIPAHLVERIFEPMFTTKQRSGGSGLGLATVRSIVEEVGGRVLVKSAPGEGTTFTVLLPMLDAASPEREPEADPEPLTTSGATILLVDDDPRVRSSVRRYLMRYGYTVLSAADPDQALAMSRQHADELDILITDYRMPRMNGIQLGQQMRVSGVDVPMLLVTGCARDVRFRGEQWGTDHLLEKPFTPRQLVGRIEASLATRRPHRSEPGGPETG